jgi:hypothetical protein
MTIAVFRTHKGDMKKTVPGSLSVRNPETGEMVLVRIFSSKEYATDLQHIPRKLQLPGNQEVDLFEDLVADGKIEIWLRCVPSQHYFGVAQADMWLRARNAPFFLNFAKGYLAIWLQIMLLIGFGVMFSTLLSGPVALIAVSGILALGLFGYGLLTTLATGENLGGGPLESLIRMVTQMNLTSEMPPGLYATFMTMIDGMLRSGLWVMAAILPDFAGLSFSDFVAEGFNIPAEQLAKYLVVTIGYLIPVFVAGYFFLKTREVAR